MPLLKPRRLGARLLRLGVKGQDVILLKERLRDLGYEIPDQTEDFDYLTQEALKDFQREHGLTIDGIAGLEVYSLLSQTNLPVCRRVHTVETGQSLKEVAYLTGLSIDTLRQYNRGRRVYVGQRLVYFDREVWGKFSSRNEGILSHLTGEIELVTLFLETSFKHLAERPIIAQVNLEKGDQVVQLHQILTSRKKRRLALDFLKEVAGRTRGVYLPWSCVSRVDGSRYLKFLSRLKRLIGNDKKLFVAVGSKMPKRNLLGGIDFPELLRISDRVVVPIEIPNTPQPFLEKTNVEKLIWRYRKFGGPWKVLLSLPLFSLDWVYGEDNEPEKLSFPQAMARIYQTGARVQKDETGQQFFRYYRKSEEHHIRIVHGEQLRDVFALVNQWSLGGVIIDGVGFEEPRLWKVISSCFHPARFS